MAIHPFPGEVDHEQQRDVAIELLNCSCKRFKARDNGNFYDFTVWSITYLAGWTALTSPSLTARYLRALAEAAEANEAESLAAATAALNEAERDLLAALKGAPLS